MLNKNSKIFLAGHKGMVGSAIFRALKKKKYKKIYTIEKKKLNLLHQNQVKNYFLKNKFDAVIIAAAKVGGILANMRNKPEFLYENLNIQNNIIHSSFSSNVKNLIFLGSSCIYPKNCNQPIKEKYLLQGPLEITNEAYAIAKIAGVKLCQYYNEKYNLNYKALMPSNLYGINDNYHLKNSHFFPALIRKIYEAKRNKKKNIVLIGNGLAMRELTFADDIGEACIFFLGKKTKHFLINIGSKKEMSIKNYAKFIMKKLNYICQIKYDKKKPNGTPRKIIDNTIAKYYGWNKYTSLETGFKITFQDFLSRFAA